jgi:hypothetical protein
VALGGAEQLRLGDHGRHRAGQHVAVELAGSSSCKLERSTVTQPLGPQPLQARDHLRRAAVHVGWAWDAVPERIERWRVGAGGERRTERALRPLAAAGWRIRHDLDDHPYGNIDHVVIGPPGVFVLDSKVWSGQVTIEDGVPVGDPTRGSGRSLVPAAAARASAGDGEWGQAAS